MWELWSGQLPVVRLQNTLVVKGYYFWFFFPQISLVHSCVLYNNWLKHLLTFCSVSLWKEEEPEEYFPFLKIGKTKRIYFLFSYLLKIVFPDEIFFLESKSGGNSKDIFSSFIFSIWYWIITSNNMSNHILNFIGFFEILFIGFLWPGIPNSD